MAHVIGLPLLLALLLCSGAVVEGMEQSKQPLSPSLSPSGTAKRLKQLKGPTNSNKPEKYEQQEHHGPKKFLCYGFEHTACDVDLKPIAEDLKAGRGPRHVVHSSATVRPAHRALGFLQQYCTPHSQVQHNAIFACPIQVGATSTVFVIVTVNARTGANTWSLRTNPDSSECLGWIVTKEGAIESKGLLWGHTSSCPHRGTDYAFMRVGVAYLLRMNIHAIDVATLTCSGGSGLEVLASPLYLLSRGYTYYQSMYGHAFVAHGEPLKIQAALGLRDQEPTAETRGKLATVIGQVKAEEQPATWQSIATAALRMCQHGGLTEETAKAFTEDKEASTVLMTELKPVADAVNGMKFEIRVVA